MGVVISYVRFPVLHLVDGQHVSFDPFHYASGGGFLQLVKILRENIGFGVDESILGGPVLLRAGITDVTDLRLVTLRGGVARHAFVLDEVIDDSLYGSGGEAPHGGGVHLLRVGRVDGVGYVDLFGVSVGSEKFLGGCNGVSPN